MWVGMWISEDHQQQLRLSLAHTGRLFAGQSRFQKVEIYDTVAYGKVLILDGVFQTSVRDEHAYHELITHPAMTLAPRIERVLIVGGGDGGTAREVLRYRGVKRVDLVEIDELVVRACKQHLPEIGSAWDDPRLHVTYADATHYVRDAAKASYDVILVDGSDPVGPAQGLFGSAFFADCRRALTLEGIYVMQSGAPWTMPDVFYPSVRELAHVFGCARPVFGEVPLYASGTWSWTLASRELDPARAQFARIVPFAQSLRTYSPALHAAAFVPPAEVARQLGASNHERP